MKMKRVFHGLSEVAGQAYYSVTGLQNIGVKTKYIVWKPNVFNYKYDISLNIDWNKKYLLPVGIIKSVLMEIVSLIECDVFHYHFGRSILLNFDLWIYKLFNKKLFFEFHGSDLRDYKQACQTNQYMVCEGLVAGREKLKKRAEKICKYADGIILHDDELIQYLPENIKNVYVVPLRLDIEKITPVYLEHNRKKIRIVHAPTNQLIKGSSYVIDAIERLALKYNVELVVVENKTQQEALEIYKSADIIVDQIRIGTYGVFAIEGMALGKPIVTYIMDDMKTALPEDLPICSANPETIYEVLEKLVLDADRRERLAYAGRAYVEKYHDYRKNAIMLADIYNGSLGPIRGRDAFEYVANISLEGK